MVVFVVEGINSIERYRGSGRGHQIRGRDPKGRARFVFESFILRAGRMRKYFQLVRIEPCDDAPEFFMHRREGVFFVP